jgi:hypothetical protein
MIHCIPRQQTFRGCCGSASLETVAGVPPEYLEAARKQVGKAGMPAFEAQLDFETRLPTPVENSIKIKRTGAVACANL